MADIKRVGDSGIHTVEGNLAGRRAAELTKEREKQREEYEVVKQKIKDQNATGALRISDKFSAETMTQKSFQVGFIDESVAKSQLEAERAAESKVLEEKKKKERAEKRKKSTLALSFNPEGEEDEDLSAAIEAPVVKRICKDPTVATSFLPDRQRDAAIEAEKERLKEEWLKQQEVIKNEFLEVVYSYWDGTGHRKEIRIRKGTTIGRFLEIVKKQISGEFKEILCVSSDSLMYVKEDLIIPHHYSFYDLIVTKARGKSGPLFHFDVHDDVRVISDARVEKDESHPGKIVERRWYEKNKHIFPASRWEVYDPNVVRENYSIHGSEVNKK